MFSDKVCESRVVILIKSFDLEFLEYWVLIKDSPGSFFPRSLEMQPQNTHVHTPCSSSAVDYSTEAR